MVKKGVERYAHLPEHPMDPYLRIIGAATWRPATQDRPCPWGLAFHVVFPLSPRPQRTVRARILSADGKMVEELPEVVYPQGPCLAHLDLYNSRVLIDREFDDVYDVHKLPPGRYRAEAELLDNLGRVCYHDALDFDVGALPYLKRRIELVFDGWKRPPVEARYLSGEALTGDLDGDGAVEFVHVVAGVHVAAYRESGELLWRYDDPEGARGYGANASVWDYNGDGKAEVMCIRGRFGELRLCMLEGATGRLIREIEYPFFNELQPIPPDAPDLWERLHATGHAIRTVEGQHMVGGYIRPANFRGLDGPRDIMLQVGEQNCVTIVALDSDLNILWHHRCENGRAGHEAGLLDADGDGCDELALGTGLLDHDGTVLWELPFETFAAPWEDDHIDESAGGDLEGNGRMEIAYSSRLVVDAMTGERLWIDPTWHGQEVRVGKLRADVPGLQLAFVDREYRHLAEPFKASHFIHGAWLDVRTASGDMLWGRRFMSMHGCQILHWLNDGLGQVCIASDLQRFAPHPNLQIFDGYGVLIDVLPAVAGHHETDVRGLVPPGMLVQHPYTPHPHGEILVYACGRHKT